MAHTYEWLIEGLAGPDCDEVDIIDVQHSDHLKDALSLASQHEHSRIAVVSDRNNGERVWAYPKDGVLPVMMKDAYGHEICRTPGSFLNEWAKVFPAQ